MGFLDHLEELRGRLFKSLIAIVLGASILFIKKDWLFDTVLFGPRKTDFFSFRMWVQTIRICRSRRFALCDRNQLRID